MTFCSPDLELLTSKCRPHFLPREFTSVIITAVIEAAVSDFSKDLNCSQNNNPDAVVIVAGVMPDFHQHTDCATRGMNTLITATRYSKNGYRAESLPAFRNSDHAAILLRSKYVNKPHCMLPVTHEVCTT